LEYAFDPWRKMAKEVYTSILILLLWTASATQSPYFPPGSLEDASRIGPSLSETYSKHLLALQEPSLWSLSKNQDEQTYRFLWLRTFDQPVAVRIDVNADGTSRLTIKMASGAGGYGTGKLVRSDTYTLTREKTTWFLGKIEENKFWGLPSIDRTRMGADGAAWVIEGARNGSYHVVDRWSPDNGPVRIIGLLMLHKLKKLKIPGPTY
jgi:hypothetical protein